MKIKLVAFDVDGVMTDGSITYDENGVEYKTFNAKDGQGITNLNKAGIITAIRCVCFRVKLCAIALG